MLPPKYVVRLAVAERTQLEELIRTGQRAASTLIHARILLKTDRGTSKNLRFEKSAFVKSGSCIINLPRNRGFSRCP